MTAQGLGNVITTPTLGHHQQVEVGGTLCLAIHKIILGIVDAALQLALKQQVDTNGRGAVELHRAVIGHRHGIVALRNGKVGGGNTGHNMLAARIAGLVGSDGHVATLRTAVEIEAFAQPPPAVIEQQRLHHTRGHLARVERDFLLSYSQHIAALLHHDDGTFGIGTHSTHRHQGVATALQVQHSGVGSDCG